MPRHFFILKNNCQNLAFKLKFPIVSQEHRDGNVIPLYKFEAEIPEVTPEELLPIIYFDEDLLVIDKPAGIPMSKNCENPRGITELLRELGRGDSAPVHRLDMETSGVLLSGRTKKSRASLSRQLKKRKIEKSYVALVDGNWDSDIAAMIAPIRPIESGFTVEVGIQEGAKAAATSFRHLDTFFDDEGLPHSLLSVRIFTGRQHQIRAHLAELGFPITGDSKYNPEKADRFPRMFLHCAQMQIIHPRTQEPITFKAPLPLEFPGA